MPALRDLQKTLLAALLRDDIPAEALSLRDDSRFLAAERLQVYRNNTQLILRDHLKSTFPVTTLLLGEGFLHAVARAFIAAFPPAIGDLNDYGADFPGFLERSPALRAHAYVPDVARLEWAAHEAYLSPRQPALTAEDLAAVADPVHLRLVLQPHLRLLRSEWPVDEIWSRVTDEGENLREMEIRPQESLVAVYRDETKVIVWSLTEGGYKLLEHLQTDPAFARAAEAALRAESDLQLDLLLARMVQEKMLVRS